jgi:hypothetical protein
MHGLDCVLDVSSVLSWGDTERGVAGPQHACAGGIFLHLCLHALMQLPSAAGAGLAMWADRLRVLQSAVHLHLFGPAILYHLQAMTHTWGLRHCTACFEVACEDVCPDAHATMQSS